MTPSGVILSIASIFLSMDPLTSQPVVLYSAQDTTEVVQAKKEAELAKSKKSEFFAIVAHELRTPLSVMRGNLEAMVDELIPASAEELDAYLDTMQKKVSDETDLI